MPDNKNNLLINKLEILNLLKNIEKSRQLISVSFDSLPHHCLTLLLDVHHEAEILIFDETNPKVTDKFIENKNEVEFSLQLEKLPVKFSSKLIINIQKPDMLYAHFPTEIYYPQNRRNYRFKTEYMNGVNATIFLSHHKKIECTLVDISVEGLCLRFQHDANNQFHVDKMIGDIHIKLPKHKSFSIEAQIRFKRFEQKNASLELGLQIQKQKNNIEKVIQQFIYHA